MIGEILSDADLRSIHQHSSGHRLDIEQSTMCGCFYCLETFSPTEIGEWIDEEKTALCPKCEIDSVLGNKNLSFATDKDVLRQMHAYWFER